MVVCDSCQSKFKLVSEVSCGHILCKKCLEVVNEHSAVCPVHRSLVAIVKRDIQQERKIDVKNDLKFVHEWEDDEEKPYNSGSMTSQFHTHIPREINYNSLIRCSYWSVGCPFQGLAFDVENHEANTRFHLDILLKSHIEQKREVQELKEKSSVMRSAMKFFEKFVSGMESAVKSVEEETKHVVPQLRNIEKELKSMKDFIAKIEKEENVNQKFEDIKSEIEKLSIRMEETKKQGCDVSLKNEKEMDQLKVFKEEISQSLDAQTAELVVCKDKLQLVQNVTDGRTFSYVWKIENFSKLRGEAVSGVCDYVQSKPFFSSRSGYKMELSIYPNGDEETLGTHMSCFLTILKGPFDDILKWPLTYDVRFILMDQSKNDHIAMDLSLDDPNFGTKPRDDDYPGWGLPKFVPLGKLKWPYLVKDIIFIKLELTLTN